MSTANHPARSPLQDGQNAQGTRVCGGQTLFDYSANPPRLRGVLGPRGSDLEALSEISRGAGPGEERLGTGLTSWSAPRSEAR